MFVIAEDAILLFLISHCLHLMMSVKIYSKEMVDFYMLRVYTITHNYYVKIICNDCMFFLILLLIQNLNVY